MKLHLTTDKIDTDLEIVLVKNKKLKENKELLEKLGFSGKDEECILLPELQKVYVGCEDETTESIKIALSCAIKKINTTNYETVFFKCKKELESCILGLELGNYSFDKYKSQKEKNKTKTIYIGVDSLTKKLQNQFEKAVALANSINLARDFINTAPDDFYPEIMAQEAIKIAKENKLECKILDEQYLEKNNMEAMLAVARASRHKAKLIHLTYKPKKKASKKVVLVGKGLTYDSGGLSLKPSDFMVSMKSDKSGGCAILGIMNTIAKLNLDVEVHGIIGAVENMIGGDAYKPDDILKAKNGTTIEVKNTDAEGRLVLADCLCYAQDEIKNIDYLIDFATLTGACVVGVGEYTSGIMGNNTKLNNKMVECALKADELATRLDFNRYLRKTLKSEVADICNIANTRYGGAITAGIFLDKFIADKNKQKWVHVDIAGPAFVDRAWGYNPAGASGAGVAMAIKFLESL